VHPPTSLHPARLKGHPGGKEVKSHDDNLYQITIVRQRLEDQLAQAQAELLALQQRQGLQRKRVDAMATEVAQVP
jgi:hypothetical protein